MHLLKSKAFERFARKNGVTDEDLRSAIEEAESGLIEADLGGGVIKQRIARKGKGKSGSYRTIIFYKLHDMAVFVYGYKKSERANISEDELRAFKDAARVVLGLNKAQIAKAIERGAYVEVE